MCKITKSTSSEEETEIDERPWPEQPSPSLSFLHQVYRRWTYSYMNKVLDKGSKQMLANGDHLTQDDLFSVPVTMESKLLAQKFRKYYDEYQDSKHRIFWAFWKIAAPTFIPAGFCQLVTVFAQAALPLLVRQLLGIFETNASAKVIREGLPWALLIFITSVINAFASHRHRHLATKTGVAVRASVIGVLYGHVLKLSPEGKIGMTSGQVNNLIAVDTHKIFEVFQEGHLVWSCPLSMTVVGILLVVIMGPTTLIGMLTLFLFVPVVKKIALVMLSIRRDRVKLSDKRVEATNSMLQGIKVTKLNNYETKYQERIEGHRNIELKYLRRELFAWAMTLVMTVMSPNLAAAGAFVAFVLVSENNILTPARTFTVLLLFATLRFPINFVGRLIGRAGQAIEASRRIDHFLQSKTIDEIDRDDSDSDVSSFDREADQPIFVAQDATFAISEAPKVQEKPKEDTSEAPTLETVRFQLSGVSCTVKAGEILAIVGPVGSGKSTFINGIIGEIQSAEGNFEADTKRVAYASQIPFILNTTLRDNILFGLPFQEERYEAVLDACCLRPDIAQLGGAGDMTEIGERGVTLSGGQKQRVSLARAAYANAELLLFDDPLSALDAGTAKKIFEKLFKAKNGLLSEAAVVLVTHAAHFLNRVDNIMLLVKGRMRFYGSWDDLSSFESDDVFTAEAVDSIRSSLQEDSDTDDTKSKTAPGDKSHEAEGKDTVEKTKGDLMTIEEREHGISSLRTWLLWFHHAGGIPFLLVQIILLSIDRFFYVATEYWLTVWTHGADEPVDVFGNEFPAQIDGRPSQYRYLAVYASILLVSTIATFMRSQWAVSGGARCAKNVFFAMLKRVLGAPMSYFETTPLGRILNRFTFDVEVVDLNLSETMSIVLISASWFFAGVTIMITIIPWIAICLVLVVFLYVLLTMHYRKSATDLQRMDAVSRSPIQAMLAEALDGSATIKVYRMRPFFLAKFHSLADNNNSALLNFITAQRWLGIRIEILGALVVGVACLLVISLNDVLKLEPGIVALLIIWASNFTVTLNFLVDSFGEGEAAITSIERVDAMSRLEQERDSKTDPSIGLSDSWPHSGEIDFRDVYLRYRKGLPLTLNGLSFNVPAGKRCGVVGRTGAGKSTLTVGLFRLVEIESGCISIDGIDLSTIGLSDVRSRLSIIPQDPVLFAGSLRECLDPFGGSTDNEILDALKAVRLSVSGHTDGNILDSQVEEGGANFSVGERQLLCLARALLAKPKVLVMDEATASVDSNTDAFIQEMLRTRFNGTTLLTVAHRLNTIMDYDMILVMDKGKAVELGSPRELLERDGVFSNLVDSTGEESASALREIARSTQ